MADVAPLRALHHDLARAGDPACLIGPPYDVVDAAQRAALAARSPYNAVHVDLPVDPEGGDPHAHAAYVLRAWREAGVLVQDDEPALWVLDQAFRAPDGAALTRRAVLARVLPDDLLPHERTHPGPVAERLALRRATGTDLSPVFCLRDDPGGAVAAALGPHLVAPRSAAVGPDGVEHRLWRVADPDAVAAACAAFAAGGPLVIADGHHRSAAARADGAGDGRLLAALVAQQDPGLLVLPTHRLLLDVRDPALQERLGAVLKARFTIEPVGLDALPPPAGDGPLELGYVDAHVRRGFRLRLADPDAGGALAPALRALDTALLEAVVLREALGEDAEALVARGALAYARSDEEAREAVLSGTADCAFFVRPVPVAQVRAVAAAGHVMPPKSTSFAPKVPAGLLFASVSG